MPQMLPIETIRAKILKYLRDYHESSISELGRNIGYNLSNIRDKLNVAKRLGHVTEETRRQLNPSGGPIIVHYYIITEAGKKWLESGEAQLT